MSAAGAVSRSGALRCVAAGTLGMWIGGTGFGAARAGEPASPGGARGPSLRTLQALIVAGGGPAHYTTLTLVSALAGSNANAVVAALTKEFDARSVKAFIVSFDFVVADALRRLKQNGLALPDTPDPDPKNAKALVGALYTAGVDPASGKYDVELMLDRLVSQRLRVEIIADVDAKYGAGATASFRLVARALMKQLGARQ